MSVSVSPPQLASTPKTVTDNKHSLTQIHTSLPLGEPNGSLADASAASPTSTASKTSAGSTSHSTSAPSSPNSAFRSTGSSIDITIPAPTLPSSSRSALDIPQLDAESMPAARPKNATPYSKEVMEYRSIVQTQTTAQSHSSPKARDASLPIARERGQEKEWERLKREDEDSGSCWCGQWWIVTGAGSVMLGPLAMSGYYIF